MRTHAHRGITAALALFFAAQSTLSAAAQNPISAAAQKSPATQEVDRIVEVLSSFLRIFDILTVIAVACAFLLFFWGVATFIKHNENTTKVQEAKNKLFWGVIGIFVLVSVWGLVRLLGFLIIGGDDPAARGNPLLKIFRLPVGAERTVVEDALRTESSLGVVVPDASGGIVAPGDPSGTENRREDPVIPAIGGTIGEGGVPATADDSTASDTPVSDDDSASSDIPADGDFPASGRGSATGGESASQDGTQQGGVTGAGEIPTGGGYPSDDGSWTAEDRAIEKRINKINKKFTEVINLEKQLKSKKLEVNTIRTHLNVPRYANRMERLNREINELSERVRRGQSELDTLIRQQVYTEEAPSFPAGGA